MGRTDGTGPNKGSTSGLRGPKNRLTGGVFNRREEFPKKSYETLKNDLQKMAHTVVEGGYS